MNDEIKKYKLYFLQLRYNNITNKLDKMEKHSDNLSKLYIYNIDEINTYLGKIYDQVKNLNTLYNEHTNSYFNNNKTEINFILNNINSNSLEKQNILNIIKTYEEEIPNVISFTDTENDIYNIIKNYGYENLLEIIEIIFNIKPKKYFSEDINNLLEEINNICIPLNFDIFDVSNETKEHYWRIPTSFDEKDILNKIRELWIKIPNKKNKYVKINVIFKMDRLSTIIKTCQINNPLLYKKKIDVLENLETKN